MKKRDIEESNIHQQSETEISTCHIDKKPNMSESVDKYLIYINKEIPDPKDKKLCIDAFYNLVTVDSLKKRGVNVNAALFGATLANNEKLIAAILPLEDVNEDFIMFGAVITNNTALLDEFIKKDPSNINAALYAAASTCNYQLIENLLKNHPSADINYIIRGAIWYNHTQIFYDYIHHPTADVNYLATVADEANNTQLLEYLMQHSRFDIYETMRLAITELCYNLVKRILNDSRFDSDKMVKKRYSIDPNISYRDDDNTICLIDIMQICPFFIPCTSETFEILKAYFSLYKFRCVSFLTNLNNPIIQEQYLKKLDNIDCFPLSRIYTILGIFIGLKLADPLTASIGDAFISEYETSSIKFNNISSIRSFATAIYKARSFTVLDNNGNPVTFNFPRDLLVKFAQHLYTYQDESQESPKPSHKMCGSLITSWQEKIFAQSRRQLQIAP